MRHKKLLAVFLAPLFALFIAAFHPQPIVQSTIIDSRPIHSEDTGSAKEALLSFAESVTIDHINLSNGLSNTDELTPWWQQPGFQILAIIAAVLLMIGMIENRRLKKLLALRGQELDQANKQIVQRDIRDPLTKLYTRHFFTEQAQIEMDRALRLESRLGLLMMDLDDFQQVTNSYGPAVGDLVLQTVAKFLQQNLRGHDLICRYENENFAILMNTIEADIFSQRAEGIRQSIMDLQTHYGDQIIQVTCSIGGAMFPKDARNLDSLIKLADDMLDLSRQGGKNQVRIYADEEDMQHP
jgi:diguanylate cyclase (GGDEF)-like protein